MRLLVSQEQARLQISEPRRHHEIVGGEFEANLAGLFDEFEILLGKRQHGNLGEVHLLAAGQLKQQIERAFEPVHINKEGRFCIRLVDFHLEGKF